MAFSDIPDGVSGAPGDETDKSTVQTKHTLATCANLRFQLVQVL